MAGKRKPAPESPTVSEEKYGVEVLLRARREKRSAKAEDDWVYLVSWVGYPPDEDTWEPYENLLCPRLAQSFWTEIHITHPHALRIAAVGTTVVPSQRWISMERANSTKDTGASDKEKEAAPDEDDEPDSDEVSGGKKRRRKNKARDPSPSPPPKKRLKKRRAIVTDDEEDDEDDDVPLPIKKPSTSKSKPVEKEKPKSKRKPAVKEEKIPKMKKRKRTPSPPNSLFSEPEEEEPVRRPEPRVQPRPEPRVVIPESVPKPAATGISTKARLAASMTEAQPLRPAGRHNFSMKINKKSSTGAVADAGLPRLNTQGGSAGPSSAVSSSAVPSGGLQGFLQGVHHKAPPKQTSSAFIPASDAQEASSERARQEAAALLASIIPQMADPFPSYQDSEVPQIPNTNFAPKPEKKLVMPSSAAASRIPRKWKWVGDVFVDVDDKGTAERAGEATITDAIDGAGARPCQISHGLMDGTSLRFENFMELSQIRSVLRACKEVQQLAKFGPKTEGDTGVITLCRWMLKNDLVSWIPWDDNTTMGNLLVFPSRMTSLRTLLNVPLTIAKPDCMVVALIPWTLRRKDRLEIEAALPSVPSLMANPPQLSYPQGEDNMLYSRSKHRYYRAKALLRFPENFFEDMRARSRPARYFIFDPPLHDLSTRYETKELKHLLMLSDAGNHGFNHDVDFGFIHVGALRHIAKLKALEERRGKAYALRFIVYGSHEDVHPDEWGYRQIYPLGGIVTFTAAVMLEDPFGCFELIQRLHKHPLWSCYILPTVMGRIATVSSDNEDPLALYDSQELMHAAHLNLANNGELALVGAPPLDKSKEVESDKWIDFQTQVAISNGPRELLALCLKAYAEKYPRRLGAHEMEKNMEKEVVDDMLSMQLQPAMVASYRRYVVIKAESEKHINCENYLLNGIEWVNVSGPDGFRLKDDYFSKESSAKVKAPA